jgi:hypothetical protein
MATCDHRQPLLDSFSCMLSRPSLNFLTHFRTIPTLMAFSPCTSELTMNISWFHISCIQKKDNRPYFTVSVTLDHLGYFKNTIHQHYLLFLYWHLWLANE